VSKGLPVLGAHWPGVKIGSLALLLPSAEPAGKMSVHAGLVASSSTVELSGAPHAASPNIEIDPVQVLPVGEPHVHAGQERSSVK
jgi:hypothetical protein